MKVRSSEKELYLFLLPSIFILLAIGIYPTAYTIYTSLHDSTLIKSGEFVGLSNYANILSNGRFWNSMYVSALFVAGCAGLELIVGLGLALLLNREFKGRSVARVLLILPMVSTPVVVGILFRLLYDADFGAINYFLNLVGIPNHPWLGDPSTALPALVMADVWEWSPFMMVILLAGLQALPRDPFEAAVIDGASRIQIFRYLTLPMLKRTLLIGLLLRTVDSFKEFDKIYVTTLGGPGTTTEVASLYVYKVGFVFLRIGDAAAMAIIMLIIVMMVSNLYLKFIKE